MKKYKFKSNNIEYKCIVKGGILRVIKDFYYGIITYKYPLCCVLNFCKDSLNSIPSALVRSQQMGMQFGNFCDKLRPKYQYVPCLNCAEKILKRKRKTK